MWYLHAKKKTPVRLRSHCTSQLFLFPVPFLFVNSSSNIFFWKKSLLWTTYSILPVHSPLSAFSNYFIPFCCIPVSGKFHLFLPASRWCAKWELHSPCLTCLNSIPSNTLFMLFFKVQHIPRSVSNFSIQLWLLIVGILAFHQKANTVSYVPFATFALVTKPR